MSEKSVDVPSESVVLKARNRTLPGFEAETQSKWNSPFFFIQAADTQLGLIDNYGDGMSPDKVTNFAQSNRRWENKGVLNPFAK